MIQNTTGKRLLIMLAAFLFIVPVQAQNYTAAEQKLIEKAKSYHDDGKYDKSISTLTKVQNAHFYDNALWELRCGYEYDRYESQLIADFITIFKKAAKGNSNFDYSKLKSTGYRNQMIGACSMATLICPKQETASWVLHEQFIEPSVDTAISEAAKEQYNSASDDFTNGNYTAARNAYEKALKMDSSYYDATEKIAMCYYKDEKYEKAIPFFKKAIQLEPLMLDPHHDLIDSYVNLKRWQEAYNECVEGIIVYPDVRYFTKMEAICEKLGKTFNRHWMKRDYIPTMINSTSQPPIQEEPWSYYRDAKNKVSEYCDEDGVIKKKIEFTDQKYLETYSWEFMLKKTTTEDSEFGFARDVQKDGYLDCFVMVSMYHIAFADQYKDFSKHNAARIRTYINTYLVK
jgi:tetratricopeptide (TPR) repeat protein